MRRSIIVCLPPEKNLSLACFNQMQKDTHDFFGREKLVDDLADRLKMSLRAEQKGGPAARMLALLGPSGSGKSSIMLAALLPGLQTGTVLNSKEWVYLEATYNELPSEKAHTY